MLKLNMRSGVSVGTVNQVTFLAGCEIQAQNNVPCAHLHIYIYSDSLQSALWVFTSKSVKYFIHRSQCKTKSTNEITQALI